jgi:starch synthase
MRILQVCAELFPFLKTGGLADVTAALPPALAELGDDVRTLLPGFAPVVDALSNSQVVAKLPSRFGAAQVRVLRGELGSSGITAYVIDAPDFYRREGGPYADAKQQAFGDNHLRFALLGWLGAQLAQGLDPQWRAQVVHAHDWHAGLTPAYLRAADQTHHMHHAGSVFTIHNLAYQGNFAAHHFGEVGLPPHFWGLNGVEYHGQLGFMKAGLYFSDRLTTVSPTYANEIKTADQGMGLDGLLRARSADLSGILNGVDDAVWNPVTDALIAARYRAEDLAGKSRCKAALQKEAGLEVAPERPLLCIVSRITSQKGLHLVLEALPQLVAAGAQFALLGSGDAAMEAAFRDAAIARPDAVSVRLGYDEAYAHRLVAGSDIIMVPSLFEPCGLTQLYGLKYGTLPLVRRVGGLADTVVDTTLEHLVDGTATGFTFDGFDSRSLVHAMRQAMALYRRPDDWRAVLRRAMAQRFDWARAAQAYHELYEQVCPAA